MKKVFIPIVALGLVATLGSCKKSWTCSCTTTVAGVSTTTSSTISNSTKSDAQKACGNTAVSVPGVASSSCEVK